MLFLDFTSHCVRRIREPASATRISSFSPRVFRARGERERTAGEICRMCNWSGRASEGPARAEGCDIFKLRGDPSRKLDEGELELPTVVRKPTWSRRKVYPKINKAGSGGLARSAFCPRGVPLENPSAVIPVVVGIPAIHGASHNPRCIHRIARRAHNPRRSTKADCSFRNTNLKITRSEIRMRIFIQIA